MKPQGGDDRLAGAAALDLCTSKLLPLTDSVTVEAGCRRADMGMAWEASSPDIDEHHSLVACSSTRLQV